MNKEQSAYLKGVAHSIEEYAERIKQPVLALQRNNLADMPIELIPINLQEVVEASRAIQQILNELMPNLPESVWKVFLERADGDEPRKPIGTIRGDTMAQALKNAAEFFEHPSHDLVVELAEEEW